MIKMCYILTEYLSCVGNIFIDRSPVWGREIVTKKTPCWMLGEPCFPPPLGSSQLPPNHSFKVNQCTSVPAREFVFAITKAVVVRFSF